MPPAYVKTIREEILYEYAKQISRFAYGTPENGICPLLICVLSATFGKGRILL
jgi:hypothetical protein